MIPPELEAKILRLHHAEGWRVGTIATQLDVHRDVVERVLQQDGIPKPRQSRPAMIDPFVPFIQRTWEKYPRLPASRLFEMCRQRGYRGRPAHFRAIVRPYRPKRPAEAYLRLKPLPGEQAQIDWGHFGRVEIGRARRQLVAFVAVLSWSRAIFVRFYLGLQTENFLRGHEEAFVRFSGVPRVCLYDNLKSAVLERVGDAIRFNPLLLDFSRHYRFEPRPVAKARGNEKGRVERAIRYVRSSFFCARTWNDLADLNRQADAWCSGPAASRRCPEDRTLTVAEALDHERPKLMELPANPFPVAERREIGVGKTPYVRFDKNDYSVPHTCVRETVTVLASLDTVRVLQGTAEIARHRRSFDQGRQIEDPEHVRDLVEHKKKARRHRGMDRLAHAAPSSRALFSELAQRGKNLGNATQRLLHLLDLYGGERLEVAVCEALQKNVPDPYAVRHLLERKQEQRGDPPPIPIPLPDPRLREISVRPHDLRSYDAIGNATVGDDDDHPKP
jgi:transposase